MAQLIQVPAITQPAQGSPNPDEMRAVTAGPLQGDALASFPLRHPEIVREQEDIARRTQSLMNKVALTGSIAGIAGAAVPIVFRKALATWPRRILMSLGLGVGSAVIGGVGAAALLSAGVRRDSEALDAKAQALLMQEMPGQGNPMALPAQPMTQPAENGQQQPKSFGAALQPRDARYATQEAAARANAPPRGLAS